MSRRFLSALAFAAAAAPLSAQSFNLDFGDPLDQPSASYAAAGVPGYWNSLRAANNTYSALNDLAGNPTGVLFHQFGAPGLLVSTDPSVTGDDAALLNDGVITFTPNLDGCFYFDGLAPGTYELITYAWRPDVPSQMAKSFVDNTPGLEISGGAWTGSHVHGVTYARHIVTVTANGFMGPHSGLAAGADSATGAVCNGMQVRRIEDQQPFCFGDGSGAACPCANSGASGRGCENSASTGGALLGSSGTTIPDTIVLAASGEKPTALTIFLQGTTSSPAIAFGDGLRCVTGTLKRLYSRNASGGAISAPQGAEPSITTRSQQLGDTIAPGTTRHYMTYYRDADPSFCPTGGTFNGSNAVAIAW